MFDAATILAATILNVLKPGPGFNHENVENIIQSKV